MTIAIPAALTGAAQTGFTAPVYNNVADTPPDYNAKQVAVTSLGGTQVGVTAHSVSSPFTISVFRPKIAGVLGKPNPVTGLIGSVPKNTYKVIVRKGVTILPGQPVQTLVARVDIDVPAGSDTVDAANVRAALSALIGTLSAVSSGLGDTVINGVL